MSGTVSVNCGNYAYYTKFLLTNFINMVQSSLYDCNFVFCVCEVTCLTKPADKSGDATSALALSAQRGDREALSHLAAEMIPLVRSQAAKYKSFLLDRDDLFQEGMLGLLSAVRTYSKNGGASFRTYAAVCIHNHIVSALRKSTGGAQAAEFVPLDDRFLPDAAQSPEEQQMLRDECEKLLQSVSTRLSPAERTVLRLFLNGFSYKEIAEKIGTTPKSVDNALQRVRHKLKK